MNRKFALPTALAATLLSVAAVAQVSPAPPSSTAPPAAQAAPATAQPAPAPQAIPAKIALISFQDAVVATNEGQRAVEEVKKKYEPQKAKLDALNAEVDSLKKQLQAAPATLPDQERASRLKTIDTKEKQLTRDSEDAQTAYSSDLQEAFGKVAQKVHVVMGNYLTQNGFTLALDVSNQQSDVTWALPSTDVTEAVIAAYNASSGVTAPPPSAPSATRPRPAAPAAPRSTTPKPPSK
jgi:outer membrane protein